MKRKATTLSIILLVIFFLWSAIGEARFVEKQKKQLPKSPSKEELLSTRNMKPKDYAKGEVLVKFKRGVDPREVETIASKHSLSIARRFSTLSKLQRQQYVLFKSDTLSTMEIMALLKADPRVEAVSPNYRRHIFQTFPNDPLFDQLWGLHNIGQAVDDCGNGTSDADIDAPEAWDTNTGSDTTVVASIDTGVDYTHEDLAGNMWINPGETPNNGRDDDGNGYIDDVYGIDAYNDDSDPMDDNGHGTHTAGTIAAIGNNNTGVTGVNWHTKIMALKFLSAQGWGFDDDAIQCIDYVMDMKMRGINIVAINASWGGGGYDPILKDAIEVAGNQGIVFCAAAGNDWSDNDIIPSYPASYNLPSIISVAATNFNDKLSWFSNYGLASVDIGAPGECILSTVPGLSEVPTGIFFDNMEYGCGNWTTGGTNDSWEITEEEAYSGTHAWSDSPGADYLDDTDSWLMVSSDIDLSSYTEHVGLGFRAWLDLEYWWDFLIVEISKDGGATWDVLGILTGHTDDWDVYGWVIPDDYKTDRFRFRFHLVTDWCITYDGVYIDDVGIGVVSGSSRYEYYRGTSMATPHVTGAVALMAAQYPSEDIYHRIDRILSGVDKIPSLNKKVSTEGRLNINNSINLSTLNPFITSVSPATGIATKITIRGIEFGATPGRVVFYDKDTEKEATIVSWSDTAITVRVPEGAPGKYLKVYNNQGKASNIIDTLSFWRFKENSNIGRDDAAAVAFNGHIYLFGGYTWYGGWCTRNAEVYDPKTNNWTQIKRMPTNRANLTAAELNGKIYVIGGYNDISGVKLNTVEAYNPATDTWEGKTPLPKSMSFMKAVTLNGKIYVTGGYDDSYNALDTLYVYDGNTWVQKASMSEARFEHGAVALNGKLYVFGGTDGYDYLSSAEVYDPGTDTWSSIADMPMPLARMGATTDGRYIYALGGTNQSWWWDALPVVLRYDPNTNTWEDLSNTLYGLLTAKSAAPAVYLPNWGIYSVNGLVPSRWESSDELEYLRMGGGNKAMPWLYLLLLGN